MLGSIEVGKVSVSTTNNKGFDVEYWADRCLSKIIYVADQSDVVIKNQALAFKDQIRIALVAFMKEAIKSDRTTLYNMLLQQGEQEMAELIRRL